MDTKKREQIHPGAGDDNVGAIILCGGKSSRMGRPKHLLPFGDETILQRISRILTEVAPTLVIVAGQEQQLPDLPANAVVVRDRAPYQGPLVGLMHGLEVANSTCRRVFLTGCDVPLLKPEFVHYLFEIDAHAEIVVPVDPRFSHPLAACYQVSLLPRIQKLVDSGERSLKSLIGTSQAIEVPVAKLRLVDSELDSLQAMNSYDEYLQQLTKWTNCPE